jgi:hypothetical protein
MSEGFAVAQHPKQGIPGGKSAGVLIFIRQKALQRK